MSTPMSDIALAAVIVGLGLSTFVTRTSFLLAGQKLKLGPRVEAALRYAPVCTLAAIIVPDVLLHGASSVDLSPYNPRLLGVCAAGIWLTWSRNVIGCLAVGMAAYTVARLLL